MVDVFRANRRFERFLFLTPHDPPPGEEEKEPEVIATITFDFEKGKVIVKRKDEEPFEV